MPLLGARHVFRSCRALTVSAGPPARALHVLRAKLFPARCTWRVRVSLGPEILRLHDPRAALGGGRVVAHAASFRKQVERTHPSRLIAVDHLPSVRTWLRRPVQTGGRASPFPLRKAQPSRRRVFTTIWLV